MTPLVFNTNLSGSGTIDTKFPTQFLNFNNPGSNLSAVSVSNHPTYNSTMGVFSLLQTPKIRFTSRINDDCQTYEDPDYGSYTNCYYDTSWKLENVGDIKWVLNPESQLTVDKLTASYVYKESYFGNTSETDPLPLGCFNEYKPVFNFGILPYISTIQDVHLKITGVFITPNNQKLVFTSLYKVDLERVDVGYTTGGFSDELVQELPSPNCTSISPPASISEIQAVCTSSQYTGRRDQFFKAPTDADANTKLNTKTNLVADMQIAPNPASNSLFLQYTLKNEGRVKIAIYDLSGKMVKSLATDDAAKEGAYSLQADLTDVASGLYFVVLDVNGKTLTQKLSVMKK